MSFIGKPAPPGYVAGIGRGATGFTTRSDIGPARETAARLTSRSDQQPAQDPADEEDLNESNYDDFAGYSGSLFGRDPYEDDDKEADEIYKEIDKHVMERGKALREAKARQELELYRQKRPKIQQQFSDLKASLKEVSELEWMTIPEVGDARNRKQRVARQDKFTPAPDSLLAHQAKLASGGERLVYIDPKTIDNPEDDDEEPQASSSTSIVPSSVKNASNYSQGLNLDELNEFRSSYMTMKLSRVSGNNSTDRQDITDPQDYLTNLQAKAPSQITDEGTLKEYRKQFALLRRSNPTFPNAWIASIRLEEAAGKLKAARLLVFEACEKCSKSPDLWLEAIRLHPLDMSKSIMMKALKENPRSVKLWIKAADLEQDDEAKRRVYAKARELVPKSVLLWKKSVELEPPQKALQILKEAVECCPDEIELLLALARLQPYEDAQRTLIKASDMRPTERSIWIAAAKLEEAAGNKSLVASIIRRSIEQISEKGIPIDRDEWYKEASDAEKAQFNVTCHEIVSQMILRDSRGKTTEEKLQFWLEDCRKFLANGSRESARGIFLAVINEPNYRKSESIWLAYVDFEDKNGTFDSLKLALRLSISQENCPKSETLWLKLAAHSQCDLDETRQIFADALEANPDSEQIIIAAVELECQNGHHKEARRILADACMSAKTPQLVKRSAELEHSLGNSDEAVRMLKSGIDHYKDYPDLYLMLGNIEEQRDRSELAKNFYSSGLKFCPTSVELWLKLAQLEERKGSIARARSKLEMARLRNPKVPLLWLESAKLELRAHASKRGPQASDRPDAALTILAKGMRECKGIAGHELLVDQQESIGKRK